MYHCWLYLYLCWTLYGTGQTNFTILNLPVGSKKEFEMLVVQDTFSWLSTVSVWKSTCISKRKRIEFEMARFYCTTCKCSTLRFTDFSGFILQDSSFNEFEWSGSQFGFKKLSPLTLSLPRVTPQILPCLIVLKIKFLC